MATKKKTDKPKKEKEDKNIIEEKNSKELKEIKIKKEPKHERSETRIEAKELSIQPEVNIGLVGHVDHGKTTLTERLSGKWTDTHSEEIKRGITIRLGYADTIFYICAKCHRYGTKEECKCGNKAIAERKVSFIDAPGHESLMATMLSGSNIMDGALLLVAANEPCPQPQTIEHIMALKIINIKNVVIVQNKIDIVDLDQAKKNHAQIRKMLQGTPYENAPIIPISAKHNVNIDKLIDAIQKFIPTPERDKNKEPIMFVARSFDVNKPGTKPNDLKGGVLGGALKQGIFKIGDELEIRPGREVEIKNQKVWQPLKTEITGLITGGKSVQEVGPGGSIGVMTKLDVSVVKSDALTGSIVGKPGKLPATLTSLTLEINLLDRVVGSREDLEVEPIKKGEPLMLNVNSSATVGIVTELGKNKFKCVLKRPVCAQKGSRVTISRRVGTRFRLIGYGILSE